MPTLDDTTSEAIASAALTAFAELDAAAANAATAAADAAYAAYIAAGGADDAADELPPDSQLESFYDVDTAVWTLRRIPSSPPECAATDAA